MNDLVLAGVFPNLPAILVKCGHEILVGPGNTAWNGEFYRLQLTQVVATHISDGYFFCLFVTHYIKGTVQQNGRGHKIGLPLSNGRRSVIFL